MSHSDNWLHQPLARLVNGTRSSKDLDSLHQSFTQYCLWLESQGGVLGEAHLSRVPSPPNVGASYSQTSSLSSPDNIFSTIFDNDRLGTFTPSSLTATTTNDNLSYTTHSQQDEAMPDLMFDEDIFSGFLPEPVDLDNIIPMNSISDAPMDWAAENRVCETESICCFALASKTLKSLHVASTTCFSTAGKRSFSNRPILNSPRTTGSVLTENREAMQALSQMLRCSCSLKIQLQLVMATICDKIVTWYHAIVHSDQSSGSDSSASYPKLRGTGRERVFCQPITIGDHCLGEAAEAQITGRVVLAHLKAIDFLIVALSKRFTANALSSSPSSHRQEMYSSSSEDNNELLSVISNRLVSHLLSQLQNAQEEATRLLVRK